MKIADFSFSTSSNPPETRLRGRKISIVRFERYREGRISRRWLDLGDDSWCLRCCFSRLSWTLRQKQEKGRKLSVRDVSNNSIYETLSISRNKHRYRSRIYGNFSNSGMTATRHQFVMNIFKSGWNNVRTCSWMIVRCQKMATKRKSFLGVQYERVNERVSSSSSCLNSTERPLTIFYFA